MRNFSFRIILILLLTSMMTELALGKAPTTVYLFPGQGSDERLFSKIKLDSSYLLIYIQYPVPRKGASMADFAQMIRMQIDTTNPYIFVGVSLGGMICSELSDGMNPHKVIIISSAKCRQELPFQYRFQKNIPIYKVIPKGMIKAGAQLLQPLVEPDRRKHKQVFKSMLKSKSPLYYKRTVSMIINWDREKANPHIIHIHGTKDHTIPIKNIDCSTKVKKGSHMMTLTRGDEMNDLLLSLL